MAVFMLDCDAVSEAGSSLSSLVSKISEISSSVNGYDTSCEDGFDFASAKSSIAANIEACSSKVQNTAQLIENVVSSHTSLQSSLKFDGSSGSSSASGGGGVSSGRSGSSSSGGKASSSSSGSTSSRGRASSSGSGSTSSRKTSSKFNTTDPEHSTSTASRSSSSQRSRVSSTNPSDTRTSGSSNTGGLSGTANVNGGSAGNSGESYSLGSNSMYSPTIDSYVSEPTPTSVAGATVISGATAINAAASSDNGSKINKFGTGGNNVETCAVINNIGHIKVGNATNNIIDNIKYNKEGYGFIGSKHVISCDKSLGKVGDVITIKQPDGTKVECVIGKVTNDKSTISFYVNDSNVSSSKTINNIANGTVKIVNKGQIGSSVISRTKLFNNKKIEVLGEERSDG